MTAAHLEHADHGPARGDWCGHVAVPRGDHVDHVHDGHRHAVHHDEH